MPGSQQAWRCLVCGFIHHGPTAPEYCPVCGASTEDFEPYEELPTQAVHRPTTQWRCLNCSYIHAGDAPPDICPVCGAEAERFEPLAEAPPEQGSTPDAIRAVVVGGGIAGVSAVEAIRQASPESSVVLISSEPCMPYYRLNLTRYLAGEIDSASMPIQPASWYDENRIELQLGRKIVVLSPAARQVELDDGRTLAYDKLILAMGSHPFVPPLPGTELGNVFTLRTAADATEIRQRIEEGTACVCIGGGILGLEVAGALARRGGDVTLLESHEWLMPRQLNAEAADVLESHMASLGVKLRKKARTEALHGCDGQVTEVELQDHEHIPCGMVVICTGVRPNTHLARKVGLDVNRGIITDNHLRTSDPAILAAGDVAEHNGVVYGVWGPSQFQGTIAGLNALGVDTPFGGLPRSNALKVLGVDMLSIGQFTPEDGSYQVIRERTADLFRHFVFHDGKMVGCILMNDAEHAAAAKQAIESHQDFSTLLRESPDCAAIVTHLCESH